MKNLNKSIIFLLVLCMLALIGCNSQSTETFRDAENGEFVELFITEAYELEEGLTLAKYMQNIKGSKKISSFTFENGMLTVLNGAKASGNIYWMLYTDDAEYSNEAWGTYQLNENLTLYSATLGAEELPVKKGCTYVWVAQAF